LTQRLSERSDQSPGQDHPPLAPSTVRWLNGTSLAARKSLGQYMTPRPVAERLVDLTQTEPGMRVLDPGAGTGELLAAVARRCPEARLTGWDIDPTALAAAAELVPGANLEQRSALDPPPVGDHPSAGFDLVIGNPPYFQVPLTPELKSRFGEVISGRANVFAFFFKAGLDLLAPGGFLAYVVPPSMNSGAYFEALREHIIRRAGITSLTLLEGSGIFEQARTAAQLLVLKKHDRLPGSQPSRQAPAGDYVFERHDPDAGFRRVIFSPDPGQIEAGFEGRQTLWQLGYAAVTGTVVWNQRRSDLRTEAGPGTVPLVWSRDLRGEPLDPSRGWPPPPDRSSGRQSKRKKPGYISSGRSLYGPALLVNRVVGSVGRGELRSALVPEGASFLAENHVNVVKQRSGTTPRIGWEELQRRIAEPGVGDRLRLMTGNTQVSATELTHLLPI
jgi:adenine-specific DNA-methyltransferase